MGSFINGTITIEAELEKGSIDDSISAKSYQDDVIPDGGIRAWGVTFGVWVLLRFSLIGAKSANPVHPGS
jgi:hypothetical protein